MSSIVMGAGSSWLAGLVWLMADLSVGSIITAEQVMEILTPEMVLEASPQILSFSPEDESLTEHVSQIVAAVFSAASASTRRDLSRLLGCP
jgi:hypothetical protein